MKRFILAVLSVFLAIAAFFMIAFYGTWRSLPPPSPSDTIRSLLFHIAHYTRETGEFPNSVAEALGYIQLKEKEMEDLSRQAGFTYLRPQSLPKDISPERMIIEFKTDEGTYFGFFNCAIEFQPSE